MIDVLTYSSDVQVWTPGVRYAAELAAALGATLTGLHIAPAWPSREPRGAPPSVMAELLAYVQEDVRAAMQAGARFDAWARELGVGSAAWHVALGDPAEVLGIAGNWCDLVVVDRRVGDRDGTCDLICEMLVAGYVCMAIPDNGYALARFDRVFVVFDGSPGAIRALHASLPLLERAANVIVLSYEQESREGAAAPRFDLACWLGDRAIRAEFEPVLEREGATAQSILAAASRNRSNLLVCGARARRGFDQSCLDPIAQHVLTYGDLPVLMAK